MLGKLKLFAKDKTECPKTQLSKRTSSSSGFSSARSERSDSSLSLNNDTNISTSQATTPSSNKSSTKKDATTKTAKAQGTIIVAKCSTKGDKRDKMQQQCENNNNNNNGNSTSSSNTTADNPPTKMHKIPQAKLQVAVGRSSKTSLSSQLPQPKPMAAIKGTTKQMQTPADSDGKKSNGEEQFDVIKLEKSQNISVNGNEQIGQKTTQIVSPITMSPLHNQLLNQTNNNINNNSISNTMTDSVHSTSTNNHSNSSESSVIYRPASDSGMPLQTDIYQMQSHQNPIPNRKLENFNDPFNGNKFNTISTKVNGMVQATSVATTIFEDDKEISGMVAMRPMMRGFNMPSRGNCMSNGYYDENGQGYCSDGDALRKTQIRYSDIENGYLSEGPHFLSILRNRPQLPSTIAEER